MPVFNGGEFLQESIDSILKQTFKDFEFLIGDDGSTDNTQQILQSQKDPRIKLFRNHKNLGIAETLNILIDSSKGEYIARQDCDDISLPLRFRKQVTFLEKNSEIGLCGTFVKFFGHKKMRLLRPIHDDEIKAFMLIGNPITHPTVMLRRSVLEKLEFSRYDQSKFPAEDYAFWFEFSRKTKLANLPEILLKYRWHKKNISTTQDKDQIRKCDQIRTNVFSKTLSHNLSDEETHLINTLYNPNFQNLKELTAFESLLLKVIEKNRNTNYYNDHALKKYLFYLWMSACFNTAQISLNQKVNLLYTSDLFNFEGLVNYISWKNIYSSIYNRLH